MRIGSVNYLSSLPIIMKKLIIAFVILFVVNLSCKKDGGLCACSPLVSPTLYIVVKNASGSDLLNSLTAGYYVKSEIQLYYKDGAGTSKAIPFMINQPFSYGNANDKFAYYQLYSSEIISLTKAGVNVFYLQLGNTAPYELALEIDQQMVVNKLLIDKKEAPKETGFVKNFLEGNLFYLVK